EGLFTAALSDTDEKDEFNDDSLNLEDSFDLGDEEGQGEGLFTAALADADEEGGFDDNFASAGIDEDRATEITEKLDAIFFSDDENLAKDKSAEVSAPEVKPKNKEIEGMISPDNSDNLESIDESLSTTDTDSPEIDNDFDALFDFKEEDNADINLGSEEELKLEERNITASAKNVAGLDTTPLNIEDDEEITVVLDADTEELDDEFITALDDADEVPPVEEGVSALEDADEELDAFLEFDDQEAEGMLDVEVLDTEELEDGLIASLSDSDEAMDTGAAVPESSESDEMDAFLILMISLMIKNQKAYWMHQTQRNLRMV
ncbi:MAG: hypothetical protein D3923_19580, partial [Candidatus Electrothrix sp. AR3]|nr:hypothetical protein [Candidatus Electrothrix sp. AR3]